MGRWPSVRAEVLPVPRLKQHLPGARRLIVAIPLAVTGACLIPGTLTPVPSLISLVAVAANANTAQQLERSIGLSVTQQWV